MLGFVLVFFLLGTPSDRALYSVDGKTPVVFATMEDCVTAARKEGLQMKAARIPGVLECVPATKDKEGVIIERNKHG